MKPSFHTKLVNSPFDDPCLYIRILREGRAIIFDLGFTTALSHGDILKTTDIFISHTHIDHFIGFDNILRVSLKKESPLNLYGPEGFTACVEGKLNSYSWNLIHDYPLSINVVEITASAVHKTRFSAKHAFKREDMGAEPFHGILMEEAFYSLSAVILDHQIPCLAFSLEEDYHINIDKSGLNSMNLPVGPWLKQLKTAIREGKEDSTFSVNGSTYSFEELRGVAQVTKGQKISYVTDAVGSKENIRKIAELAKDSDTLFIESYFLDEDQERAKNRYHLTAKEAGTIARAAGAGKMEIIHVSPRYVDKYYNISKEAQEAFAGRKS
jgi:ribonuclease Z